jgi:hypothetical protein
MKSNLVKAVFGLVFIALTGCISNENKSEKSQTLVGFDYTITDKKINPYTNDIVTFYIIANTRIDNREGLLNLANEILKSNSEYKGFNQLRVEIIAFNSNGQEVKTNFTSYQIKRMADGYIHEIDSSGYNEYKDKDGNIWKETFLGVVK